MWCRSKPPTGIDLEFKKGNIKPSRYLQWLERWDLSTVRKDAVEKSILASNEATSVVSEYRRFMALTAGCPKLAIPASGKVDKFWHHHLLFTHNYHGMCMKAFRRFIHHEPAILAEDSDAKCLTPEQLDALFLKELSVKRRRKFW